MGQSAAVDADSPVPRSRPPWWDLALLLHDRALLASLDPRAAPTLLPVAARQPNPPRRLGLLAGSFNPVTLAHVHLARAALRSGRCDAVWFLMSVRTVDKETATGALLEDRLAVLRRVVDDTDPAHLGVALCNRGLYVDQAEAAGALAPPPEEVVMIVGFDKIVQIFDPRYYDDRDDALARLFARTSFLVAERAGSGAEALQALLARRENRPYAPRVSALVDPSLHDVSQLSSTRIRAAVAGSSDDVARDVPSAVAAFVRETGAYAKAEGPADRYAVRAALLSAMAARQGGPPPVDLRRLVDRLTAGDPAAEAARNALLTASPSEAARALAPLLEAHAVADVPDAPTAAAPC